MSNVDTARSAYDAFGKGDLASLSEDFAENAVWVTSDELPLGGTTEGRDEIMGNFAQIPNYWTEFSVTPEEFIEADGCVVVRGTQHAANAKGSMDAPFVHILRYDDAGKVVRGEFHTDTAKAAKLLS
jgi:ketosteroid isomerase-like protein